MSRETLLKLQNLKQYKQKSPEWYQKRISLITASSAASLLIRDQNTCEPYVKEYSLEDTFDYNKKSCNPYNTKTQYMLDKCKQGTFKGNIATFWGQKYEQVVIDIYSKEKKSEVIEFGLIIHQEYEWLGASPDGITEKGIMLEIKCPLRRKITGIPPLYYWIQVQLQMEVCDLNYCDFVEYEFMEFETEEEYLDDETLDVTIYNRGILIEVDKYFDKYNGIPTDPSKLEYIYPPKDIIDNNNGLLEWKNKIMNKVPNNAIYKPVYWKAIDRSILRIRRNKEWFENVKPMLESNWKQLVFYQKGDNYKKLLTRDSKNYISGSTLNLVSDDDEETCLFSSEDES